MKVAKISGNFKIHDSRAGYTVYDSQKHGHDRLTHYNEMEVTGTCAYADKNGGPVLIVTIDPWSLE